MSILVIRNGLLDTAQDAGRYGHQHLAINPGGAMDIVAMVAANALVGNDVTEAVLEMHFPAAQLLFEEAALIAITGADFAATINNEPVLILKPIWVPANATLRFTRQVSGARVYLAVQGGYKIKEWMGSNSTNLKVQSGGFKGRQLQKNDRIFIKAKKNNRWIIETDTIIQLPWKANVVDAYNPNALHFIEGAEYENLAIPSRQKLQTHSFTIGLQSDRMGYRLHGEGLAMQNQGDMISTAITKGSIQLLPDGQLIILMADHQTTGGYPRVGHIISADIPSLAQKKAGESLTLKKLTMEEAEQKLLAQQRNLQQLRNACIFRLQQYFL